MVEISTAPTLTAPPGGYVSPEVLKMQQEYAKALLSGSMSDAPVRSWSQGLGNMVEALVGGTIARKAGERQTAAESVAMGQSADLITALMNPAGAAASPGGGVGTPPSTPAPSSPDMFGTALDAATPDVTAAPPMAAPTVTPAPSGGSAIDPARVRAVLANPYIPAETKQQILALWGKRVPEYDFSTVGDQLVRTEKHTGAVSPAFTADAKPSPEYGDYLKYKANGGTKSQEEYFLEMKSAGRSQVNIDQKAETAEAAARGGAVVDHFKALAADLPAADQLAQGVGQLEGLLQGVDTGTQAALRSWIQQNTGIALGEGADKLQAVNSLVDYMAPRMRVPGSGSSSDRDVAMFKSSLPALINQPGGNKLIIDTLRSMSNHRIAVAQISEDYLTGQIDSKSALEKMRALPDPLADFKAAAPAASSGAPAPAAAAPPAPAGPSPGAIQEGKGGIQYRFKGGDYKDRNNWEPMNAPAPLPPSPLYKTGAATGSGIKLFDMPYGSLGG